MPGIVDPSSVGLNYREVGKMMHPDEMDFTSMGFLSMGDTQIVDDFNEFLHSDRSNTVFDSVLSDSAPSSSSSSPSRDNNESEGELPEEVERLNIEKYWGNPAVLNDHIDSDFLGENCKLKLPSKNPFMGTEKVRSSNPFIGTEHPPMDALFNHLASLDDSFPHTYSHANQTQHFSGWEHAPSEDTEHILMLISSSSSVNEDCDEMLPDTPSSLSGTVTGDESDVDIETVSDMPRTADDCGYATHDSSPALSPATSPSPLQNHATSNSQLSNLHRSHSSTHFPSSPLSSSPKSVIHYSSCGVSNNASLAENLLCGRPSISQKRKLKEKKLSNKNSHNFTHSFQSIGYPTSGPSVNFHDYAMSPASCMETAQPTVLSPKRMCKKRQHLNTLDLSEKEKQNHHNQLERNRRQKLADLFVDLREQVPNICNQTKASKVMILNKATTFIKDLREHESSQVRQLAKELEKHNFLKRQKKQLEAQLSSVK